MLEYFTNLDINLENVIIGIYQKYFFTSALFVFSRLTTSYSRNEILGTKIKEGLLFGGIASINEFLIDVNITENYSLSYIPIVMSLTYKQDVLGENLKYNTFISLASGITTKVLYDSGLWKSLIYPVATYAIAKKNGISSYLSLSMGTLSLAEELAINYQLVLCLMHPR